MKSSLWKYLPPPGPVLSLWLIALVLLSALLYHRAVNIQRYLEPVIGVFLPRSEFARSVNQAFQKEFGTEPVRGVKFNSNSIFVEKSLLFSRDGALNAASQIVLKKLARMFLTLMEDKHMRSDIRLIQVSARFSSYGHGRANAVPRMNTQRMVGLIQDVLIEAEPELGKRYSSYFEVSAQPVYLQRNNTELLEFRIIPSELLYIEVLQRLVKYAR